MKIAAAQIACVLGDLSANLRKIHDFASQARDAGAELVVFPEMADTGYEMRVIREEARPWSEGAVPDLQEIARTLSLAIICGVSERAGDCIYNSQVVIDTQGAIVAKYRKTHLFAPVREDEFCTPGDELASYALGPLRLGLCICYDLRFPEFHRALAVEKDVNVFVISSAWPMRRAEHLRILARARAIENQSYVILANRVGTDAGATFCGGSAVIDPAGLVIASAVTQNEELVLAEISEATLQKIRASMKVFAHRRPDLYERSRAEK